MEITSCGLLCTPLYNTILQYKHSEQDKEQDKEILDSFLKISKKSSFILLILKYCKAHGVYAISFPVVQYPSNLTCVGNA